MQKKGKNRIGRLLAVCYIACALIWLLFAAINFATDRAQQESELSVYDAEFVDMVLVADMAWQTQSIDAQMIWHDVNTQVRTLWLKGKFNEQPGEIEVFFAHGEDEGFLPKNRRIAQPYNGGWLVRLPAGQISALRIDAGVQNRNLLFIGSIVLNPQLSAAHYFVPSLRWVLFLLFVPLIACCVILEVLEVYKHICNRKAQSK